jgi:hypothetical protein
MLITFDMTGLFSYKKIFNPFYVELAEWGSAAA